METFERISEKTWPSARLAHNCGILQANTWICDDCGDTFDRDPALGEFPEEAIIEGVCEFVLEQEEWEARKKWGFETGGEG